MAADLPGALGLDFLTQIVNVHWGGGAVFVTGDYGAYHMYAKIKNTTDPVEFESLGTAGFPVEGYLNGGLYRNMAAESEEARPLFLMVGNNGYIGPDFNGFKGLITASNDGIEWRTVFTVEADQLQENAASSADIFGVVWDEDENAFYAGGHFYRHDADAESLQSDLDKVYKSSDGESWVEVGSAATTVDTTTGMFASHLNNKANLPGGVFGYQETKDDAGTITKSVLVEPVTPPKINYASRQPTGTVAPIPAFFQHSISTKDAGNEVKITIEEGGTTTKTVVVTGLDFVNCVGYANGIFIAAGGVGASDPPDVADGRIAVSFDEGDTWQAAGNSLYQVYCVSGAPPSEL